MVNLLPVSWRRWQLMLVAIALLIISFSISSCSQFSLIEDGQSSNPQTDHVSEFVPKHALLAAVIDTTPKPDKAWSQSALSRVLSQTLDRLLTPLELDFSEDIRPWLGQTIAFAITNKDLDRDYRNGRQGGYLLAANTLDGDRLREFLELFWQRQAIAGANPVLTQDSGVPIIAGLVSKEKHQLATAIVGENTLLIANDIKVLQQSLRVAQTPTLQLSKPDLRKHIWFNISIPDFVDWLGVATPPANLPIMSAPRWQQLSATTAFHPQRLTINTQLKLLDSIHTPKTAELYKKPSEVLEASPAQYLPASLAWGATGDDLRPLWTEIENELDSYQRVVPPLAQSHKWISTQLAQTLLAPLTQLFSGGYAVGQLNDGSWLIAVVNTDSTLTNQLDNIAVKQGLTVSQLTLQDRSVTAWSRLKTRVNNTRNRETTVETDLVALHTKVNNCDIFTTSIDGLTAALRPSNNALTDTQSFQRTMTSIDDSNQGYFYGTWDEIERLLASNRWFSLVKPIVQPWIQPIDAIAITSYKQTNNQSTGTISILLKD
ncbi:MAG: DUF3352 domain-containing protein [Cyanobacteria bacterium P01_H01_bin.105]